MAARGSGWPGWTLVLLVAGLSADARPQPPSISEEKKIPHHHHSIHKVSHTTHSVLTPLENRAASIYGVFLAGSKGWENYRHQAAVYRMWQLLKDGGVPEENLVAFHYDDIAYDKRNPERGHVFNGVGAADVYPGVGKDYTGEKVTSANFYAAITGVSELAGGGKVAMAGTADTLVVYIAGTGAPGVLPLPGWPEDALWGDQLRDALGKVKARYTLVIVETPRGGHWLESLLPPQGPGRPRMLVVSTADAGEDNWATACLDPAKFWEGGPCQADEVSQTLMSALEQKQDESLAKALNHTVGSRSHEVHGSKVRWWGSQDILDKDVWDLLGVREQGSGPQPHVPKMEAAPGLRVGEVNDDAPRLDMIGDILRDLDEDEGRVAAGDNATLVYLRNRAERLAQMADVRGKKTEMEVHHRERGHHMDRFSAPSAYKSVFTKQAMSPAAHRAYDALAPVQKKDHAGQARAMADEYAGQLHKTRAAMEEMIRVVVGDKTYPEALVGGQREHVVHNYRCYRDMLTTFGQVCAADFVGHPAVIPYLGSLAFFCDMQAGFETLVRGAGGVCNPNKDGDWISVIARTSTMHGVKADRS